MDDGLPGQVGKPAVEAAAVVFNSARAVAQILSLSTADDNVLVIHTKRGPVILKHVE